MNISIQFGQELSKLAAGGAGSLTVTADPRRLVCQITQSTPLAVEFDELRLETSELANASVADLQRLSESLAARLTYLLEPIAPIEADAEQCTVQMRSNPPQKDDDGRSYYELLVRRGGQLHLVRYRKEPRQPRHRIPATVTTEVLLRLADDFCAVLD
jgi:hypothetical protein